MGYNEGGTEAHMSNAARGRQIHAAVRACVVECLSFSPLLGGASIAKNTKQDVTSRVSLPLLGRGVVVEGANNHRTFRDL